MKITDVKIYTLDAFRTNWAFIKVETAKAIALAVHAFYKK